MLIPYTTDAPVYYWPFATVGLIGLNVVVFCGVMFGEIGPFENWLLEYGNGLHPDQWFRAMFMHAGFEHLLGNMLFLWVFGLVVEGKRGWWKFLLCYLGIGVTQSMIEQTVMLGYAGDVPGSVGASAAIFGLIAMATIWAPMNEISFMWGVYYFWTHTVDVSIAVLAAVYAGMELLLLLLSGGTAGSSWLHLGGFLLGLPLGIVLLKRGVVDCEGWDIFHVWRGDYGAFKKEPEPAEVFAKVDARRKCRDEQMLAAARQQFRLYLKQGNADAALRLYEKLKDVGGGLILDRDELLAVIQALHAAKRWRDSAPHMAEFIARFPDRADAMRIKLAQICAVELQRPGKALELLADVDKTKLAEQQALLVRRITAKAHALQAEGTVELDVETW
jgi:membrane associated rhomboid family serine protease